jgi:hypothetical protein
MGNKLTLTYFFFQINSNAFAYIVLCTIILLDGAGIRQQLGFDDHRRGSDFSDDEHIGGGK